MSNDTRQCSNMLCETYGGQKNIIMMSECMSGSISMSGLNTFWQYMSECIAQNICQAYRVVYQACRAYSAVYSSNHNVRMYVSQTNIWLFVRHTEQSYLFYLMSPNSEYMSNMHSYVCFSVMYCVSSSEYMSSLHWINDSIIMPECMWGSECQLETIYILS